MTVSICTIIELFWLILYSVIVKLHDDSGLYYYVLKLTWSIRFFPSSGKPMIYEQDLKQSDPNPALKTEIGHSLYTDTRRQ